MGILNIEDELHDQLRRASKVSYRSINAQAAFWIRIGMLCETKPDLNFTEIMARELAAAGVLGAEVSAAGPSGHAAPDLVAVAHDQAA